MPEAQEPYVLRLPDEREAWTAANIVIGDHGANAAGHAASRIEALTAAGDEMGAQTWRLILDRIGSLQDLAGGPLRH